MRVNQTLMIPYLFYEATATTITSSGNSAQKMSTYASEAKEYLDKALTAGWQIKIVTPILYHDVTYIHYVLEKEM